MGPVDHRELERVDLVDQPEDGTVLANTQVEAPRQLVEDQKSFLDVEGAVVGLVDRDLRIGVGVDRREEDNLRVARREFVGRRVVSRIGLLVIVLLQGKVADRADIIC